jgi:hypothetical protein
MSTDNLSEQVNLSSVTDANSSLNKKSGKKIISLALFFILIITIISGVSVYFLLKNNDSSDNIDQTNDQINTSDTSSTTTYTTKNYRFTECKLNLEYLSSWESSEVQEAAMYVPPTKSYYISFTKNGYTVNFQCNPYVDDISEATAYTWENILVFKTTTVTKVTYFKDVAKTQPEITLYYVKGKTPENNMYSPVSDFSVGSAKYGITYKYPTDFVITDTNKAEYEQTVSEMDNIVKNATILAD